MIEVSVDEVTLKDDRWVLLAVLECDRCDGAGCEYCADTGRISERKPIVGDIRALMEGLGAQKQRWDRPMEVTMYPGTYLVWRIEEDDSE